MSMIQDGTGDSFWAKVTPNNRLMTTGVDLTLTEAATETGDTYNINTGEITLTGTGESALLYIENSEENNLLITSIIVNIKDFVGTAGQPELIIYRRPTNGTIETNAIEAQQTNRNYGSSKKIDANIYQGVEGDTITGETDQIKVYLPSVAALTLVSFDTLVVLPKGGTIALSYIPPAGITSMDIIVAVNATLNGSQL